MIMIMNEAFIPFALASAAEVGGAGDTAGDGAVTFAATDDGGLELVPVATLRLLALVVAPRRAAADADADVDEDEAERGVGNFIALLLRVPTRPRSWSSRRRSVASIRSISFSSERTAESGCGGAEASNGPEPNPFAFL